MKDLGRLEEQANRYLMILWSPALGKEKPLTVTQTDAWPAGEQCWGSWWKVSSTWTSSAWNKESLFHHEDSQAVEQCDQRGCAVSIVTDFKICLNKTLSSLVWPHHWPCFEHEVGLETSWGLFWTVLSIDSVSHQPKYSCEIWWLHHSLCWQRYIFLCCSGVWVWFFFNKKTNDG